MTHNEIVSIVNILYPGCHPMYIAERVKLVEEKFTATNNASFQLPLTIESCIEHLRAIWGDIHITAEVRCAVEETYDFIERQLQTGVAYEKTY